MDRKHPNAPSQALITTTTHPGDSAPDMDEALRRVLDKPLFVPPLDVAENIARQALAEAESLDYELAPGPVLARHIGSLTCALRMVLDALDAEVGKAAQR